MSQMQLQNGNRLLTLQMAPVIELTDEQLYEFCQLNPSMQIERTTEGELIIMTPAGGETSRRNVKLVVALEVWAEQDGEGVVFDSSGGFVLPNGAMRAPDAAWVKRVRLTALTPEQKQKFIPLCPDFVIELRSPSDSLSVLQEKMQEYMENGAQLGWLIDPEHKQVYIYHSDGQVKRLQDAATLSGETALTGFELDLQKIWRVDF